MKTFVISVGGSIIVPKEVDHTFLKSFKDRLDGYLKSHEDVRLILVTGGGYTAREYQSAFRGANGVSDPSIEDWIGIYATRINAMLLKSIFSEYAPDDIVTNPTIDNLNFTGRVLVASGWKPGFSTDTDATYLARRFGSKLIINLSNIKKVYTDDPKKNPNATPIDSIEWRDFRKLVGDEWVPGKNAPFDPIASKMAEESSIKVICADGRNTDNLVSILEDRPYEGTLIY